jgi:broad specificity phosphatase PhoE
MLKLIPVPQQTGFLREINYHLYPYSVALPFQHIFDIQDLQQLDMFVHTESYFGGQTHLILRHFESNYNLLKETFKQSQLYKDFLQETYAPKKKALCTALIANFISEVGVDYEVPLSENGKQTAQAVGKQLSAFYDQHPEVFPSYIVVSPYLRTRSSAYYLLESVKGLDIDLRLLTGEGRNDRTIGTFRGKPVEINLEDQLRERDHGRDIAPNFLKPYLEGDDQLFEMLPVLTRMKLEYYTSPRGGESQIAVNGRVNNFLQYLEQRARHQQTLIITHHLVINAILQYIFKGAFNTFYNFDTYWRPQNGSFTFITKFIKDPHRPKEKLRLAAYNLVPQL